MRVPWPHFSFALRPAPANDEPTLNTRLLRAAPEACLLGSRLQARAREAPRLEHGHLGDFPGALSLDPETLKHEVEAALDRRRPRVSVTLPAAWLGSRRVSTPNAPDGSASVDKAKTEPAPGGGGEQTGGKPELSVYELTLLDGRRVEKVRTVLRDKEGRRRKTFSFRDPASGADLGEQPADLLPLYAHERLRDSDREVVVCEGEQAADALLNRRIPAVGTTTGALRVHAPAALVPLLRRKVVLWPDADMVGRTHMDLLAERLKALGVAEIRVVRWQGAPARGDAADFGGDDAALRKLIDEAQPWPEAQSVSARPPSSPLRLSLGPGSRAQRRLDQAAAQSSWRQGAALLRHVAPLLEKAEGGQPLTVAEAVELRLAHAQVAAIIGPAPTRVAAPGGGAPVAPLKSKPQRGNSTRRPLRRAKTQERRR